jgi:hypothetical protein
MGTGGRERGCGEGSEQREWENRQESKGNEKYYTFF